ncbi:uncharacterized protein LOC110435438 isoform X3 [Sorghum bicolor]|uniref:uncharacterized protein LOC110435438 isoform X3 n=1 Tax=Sorghum bicolor TaxID=4558 RepID=UPI000B4260B0|nr:uncharacterized protein LOC110435438 isoform X3 [Sorghum bicolor]|eukprot:XP_021316655.1 uncharacterized protein LOC110435438 isoform X3 [Sorghum bicolor]
MDGGGRPSARWPSTATPGTATLARTDPGAATPAWWRFGSCGTAAQTRFSIRYTTGNLLQVITKVHNGEKGCSSCWIISLEYLQKGHAHQFG